LLPQWKGGSHFHRSSRNKYGENKVRASSWETTKGRRERMNQAMAQKEGKYGGYIRHKNTPCLLPRKSEKNKTIWGEKRPIKFKG